MSLKGVAFLYQLVGVKPIERAVTWNAWHTPHLCQHMLPVEN